MLAAAKLPSREVALEARAALRELSTIPGHEASARVVEIRTKSKARAEGESKPISVTIPHEAFELFLEVLGQMADGNAVTIMPVHAELTTQQAADMLNVSRPYLVGLLDSKKIPFRLVGTHRRVLASDLLAFKKKDDAYRRTVLDELTAEAENHGLGY